MCMGGGGSPPKQKPLPEQEQKVEQAVSDAKDRERMRQRQASGYQSTLLTGPGGLTGAASIGNKTLLGS